MKYSLLTSAKINLGLTIIDRLPDGYHEIESIFLPIGIYDKVDCEFNLNSDSKEIKVIPNIYLPNKNDIPNDFRNIAWRVVEFVEKLVDIKIGFSITIEKNIPIGSGLGGGSGNGAGVLISLLRFLEDKNIIDGVVKNKIISEIHKVGSDIPFFLYSGACVVQGKGEKITPINGLIEKFSEFGLVIVYPKIFSSTKEAYKFVDENNLYSSDRWAFEISFGLTKGNVEIRSLKKMLKNTFELFIIEPVRKIKEELYLRNAMFALMSGSGSSVYGIFDQSVDLKKVKSELINKLNLDNDQIFITRFVKEPVQFI